jgi:carboxymethylenebutenolidase
MFLEKSIAVVGALPLALHLLRMPGRAGGLLPPMETEQDGMNARLVIYPGKGATLAGYLALPKDNPPFPAVLIVNEIDGLNDHSRTLARRLARQGVAALAIDPLSRKGGTDSFTSAEQARQAIRTLSPALAAADLAAGVAYLRSHPAVAAKRIRRMALPFTPQT